MRYKAFLRPLGQRYTFFFPIALKETATRNAGEDVREEEPYAHGGTALWHGHDGNQRDMGDVAQGQTT